MTGAPEEKAGAGQEKTYADLAAELAYTKKRFGQLLERYHRIIKNDEPAAKVLFDAIEAHMREEMLHGGREYRTWDCDLWEAAGLPRDGGLNLQAQ